VAKDELFDLTPYAGAYVRYIVRHPTTQGMPRKVKTSFDGGPRDRAISGIHDVAFRARVRDIEGRGEVRGVEMMVGGGTSIMPRVAPVLYEFLELDNGEYLKITEAVMRIFDRQEWLRVNRARARIKVFVDKYGIEELRNQVEEELKGDWVGERDFSVEHRLFSDDERESAPGAPSSYGSPNGEESEFERFASANVAEQKQDGFVTVEVKVTRGDLSPEQFRGLAKVMRDYAGGYARTTVQQNIVLRWVRAECVYDVWRALSELGLGDAGSREISDVVSCPGTDSCKLGITSSMGLNQAVQERIEAMQISDELTRALNIKISGCPNGCGQHHVGSIGFTGASIKVGDHTIPAYIPHVGGVWEGGEVKFGTRLKLRLPSKRVPDAIERWIGHYQGNRDEDEQWNDFVERVGTAELEGLVKDLSLPVDFGLETMNQFIDWNRDVPFEVIRGEGECAV
jgi:sulfite reductase beta subunit-like hemoprotein